MKRAALVPIFALILGLPALALLAPGCGLLPQRSEGEILWRQHCAECHGLDGSGNTVRYMGKPYADLLDDAWKIGGDEVSIEQATRDGSFGEMPSFDHLPAREIRLLVQYVRELRGDALPGSADGDSF